MANAERTRTRENAEVRRAKILDEAIRIIGQRGYYGFTVQELAQRCGLTNAGLLYHFASKDQLLGAVVQELERREIHAVSPLVALASTDPSAAAIVELLSVIAERGSAQPELGRLYAVLQSETLDPSHPAHDSFRRREAATLNLFEKLVAPHVADPRLTARQVLAVIDGLRLQWLRADQGFDVVAEWIHAITVLVPALASPRRTATTRPRAKARAVASRRARQAPAPKNRKPVKRR